MSETILAAEPAIRLAAFPGVPAAMALWADRLHGACIVQPATDHERMKVAIGPCRARRNLRLDRMLIQPLRSPASGGALDPRITTREPSR